MPHKVKNAIRSILFYVGLLQLNTVAGSLDPVPSRLHENTAHRFIMASLESLYHQDYLRADSLLIAAGMPGSPASLYFGGLVALSRFEDWGDTASLRKGRTLWEKLLDKAPGGFPKTGQDSLYLGLTHIQLAYVAKVEGHDLRAGWMGRKAMQLLESQSQYAEARSALALIAYYKATLLHKLNWMPFVSGNPEQPLLALEKSYRESEYLRILLQTSLIWLYYDRHQYESGLVLIRNFLERYPGNRMYRQMLGDFHFRNGQIDSAQLIFNGLAAEYRQLKASGKVALQTGLACSVGNLIKIASARGDLKEKQRLARVWKNLMNSGLTPWMPTSLMREVKSLLDNK